MRLLEAITIFCRLQELWGCIGCITENSDAHSSGRRIWDRRIISCKRMGCVVSTTTYNKIGPLR